MFNGKNKNEYQLINISFLFISGYVREAKGKQIYLKENLNLKC